MIEKLNLDEVYKLEQNYINAFEKLLKLKQKKQEIERELKEIEAQEEMIVAFDETLKNDRQRNAKKYSLLLTNRNYIDLKKQLENLEKQIIQAEVDYQHKKNLYKINFELLKLLNKEDN